jgi:tripartite-type tricarboxylate transporter receptor subunit TctC
MKSKRISSFIRTCTLLAVAFSALLILHGSLPTDATAAYPDKPIRWVVPSTPGGGTDTTTRIIAPALSKALGQPVVIENRPGGSGNIGALYVAKAAPDGYTLLTCIASNASNAALKTGIGFDLDKDFTPISLLVTLPNVFVRNPSFPQKTLQELIAYAKANPGKLQYSSGGMGSIQHMTMELLQNMTGTKFLHVPYKATAPALTDAVSGYLPLTVASRLTTLPMVRAGRLEAYGVTSSKRSSAAPEIPTIAEQGVPGFEAVQWWGMLTPAGTPKEIVEKLHAAVLRAMEDPDVKRHFAREGADITTSPTPEAFSDLIRSDLAKWKKVVKDSGMKVE